MANYPYIIRYPVLSGALSFIDLEVDNIHYMSSAVKLSLEI